MILLPPHMYREFHLGIVIAKKMRMKMKTRVPRNLFGAPERKDSAQLLQETLEQERAHFHKRWSVDPLAEDEDKENGPRAGCNARLTPKKRRSPYVKQTSMHDFWRSRKVYETSKKSPSACADAPRPAPLQSPPHMQSLSQSPPQPHVPAPTEPAPEPAAQSTVQKAQPLLDDACTDNSFYSVQPSVN